ncbi:MAG: mannosyltransferase family protein, partial [Chloroflexota bacterium]
MLPPFLTTRALLLATTAVLATVAHRWPMLLWDQWDSRWYLGVAAHGYHWSLDGKSSLAFFPLYPLLLRVGDALGLPPVVVGLLVSNIAFAGALFYLHRLIAGRWGTTRATRAVWLISLFPTAFFTFAPYTDSLFLLCAAATLYYARRQEPLQAGLWLAAAVLCRSTGAILVPVMLVAFNDHRRLRFYALSLAPGCCAILAYAAYLGRQHFSLLAVPAAQVDWHRAFTLPWTGFTSSVAWLAAHGEAHMAWSVENLLSIVVTVVFLGLTVVAWRHLDPQIAVYCAGFWLLVLTSPEWLNGYYAPFSSMDRLVLALFPLAGWVAARLPLGKFRLLACSFALLMVGAATVHM